MKYRKRKKWIFLLIGAIILYLISKSNRSQYKFQAAKPKNTIKKGGKIILLSAYMHNSLIFFCILILSVKLDGGIAAILKKLYIVMDARNIIILPYIFIALMTIFIGRLMDNKKLNWNKNIQKAVFTLFPILIVILMCTILFMDSLLSIDCRDKELMGFSTLLYILSCLAVFMGSNVSFAINQRSFQQSYFKSLKILSQSL